jgi:transketolase
MAQSLAPAYGQPMLNQQPHINTHEPSIWRDLAQELPLGRVHTSRTRATWQSLTSYALPTWSPGELVATHEAYDTALRAIEATDPRVVGMEDGLVHSMQPRLSQEPGPVLQRLVAEQQLVASAIALQTQGKVPFAATFADSWTSAHDLIQMAAIEGADIRLIGSHAAPAGDEDGTTQVALGDIAMFRALHDSTVLVTSDANQTAALVETMLGQPGVVYLRTLRIATPVIYRPGQRFNVAGSRTLRSSTYDDVTLLGAGATVHEALAAAELLVPFGIRARVIDLYSVRPLDTPTLLQAAEETGNLIVAEDHWAEGGLGDAVLEALAEADSTARIRRLGVHTRPAAGRPEELLERTGVGRTWIATAARDLLEQPRHDDHHRAHRLARMLHR